jgi:uncharacterized protein
VSDLELKAQDASSVLPATELHGMVCGFAAGNPQSFSLSDFVQLTGSDVLSTESAVEAFISASLDEFYAQDMSFLPLVPDDEAPLSARLSGLAQWCAGFLGGFGATVNLQRDALHIDIQEILRDFASISSIDDEVEGDEQDESSFVEIYEYVRVGAILTMTLMGDEATDEKTP